MELSEVCSANKHFAQLRTGLTVESKPFTDVGYFRSKMKVAVVTLLLVALVAMTSAFGYYPKFGYGYRGYASPFYGGFGGGFGLGVGGYGVGYGGFGLGGYGLGGVGLGGVGLGGVGLGGFGKGFGGFYGKGESVA